MNIDDARPGLKYIMVRRLAESWDFASFAEEGVRGFSIFEKVRGRSKRQEFFVPMANVEEAERHLSVGGLPGAWVHLELERIKD